MESSDEETDTLCKDCSTLLPYTPFKDGPQERRITYPDFPEIEASASKGCALCPLYLQALREMYDEQGRPLALECWWRRLESDPWPIPNWDRVVTLTNPRLLNSKHPIKHVLSQISPPPPRSDRGRPYELGEVRFDLWADAGDAAALDGGISLRPPEKNSLSDGNITRILGWLDNCLADHACCRIEKLPRLPTRVIDVGALGGRSPRLLETNRQPAHYIALSHCWGSQISSHTTLRLWQSNVQDLLSEIPLGSISKTFQDAIEVVRKLKFRYLWIDALCIIQDSRSDWEDESARMNDVYECSHLTLVATSAVSSNEGFVERPRLPIVTLPYRDDDDPTIEGRFSISRSIYGRHPWDLVDRTAWNTRGWTYQERMLSRRLLHFTSSVLFWECRAIDRSEVNARQRRLHDRPRWILTHPGEDQPAVDQHDIYGKYDRWYLILYAFTARRFTYTSDLLPAISGLATIFQQSFAEEDDYIAGIWSHDFAQGLLWLVQDSSATSKAMLDYWAPSWSWASIMGKVYWPTRSVARHQRDDSAVDLVDNRLKLFHDNPMGTVLGGYIRIRGRLRQLSCVSRPVEWGAFSRFRYDLWCEGNTLVGNGQFDVDQDDSAEEIWLLQVKSQQDGDCFFPYHPTALMLERVPESWLKFVRLGCAVLDDEQLDFFDVCEPQDFELY